MIRYWVFWLGAKLAPLVPPAWGYHLATLVGQLAYFLAPGARGTVRANIAQVLGKAVQPSQLERTVRAVFVNAARNYFDLLRLARFDAKETERRLTFHGLEHLNQAVAQGRGVVLVTVHMGNIDVVAQSLLRLYPSLTVIIPAEPIRPEPLLRLVTGLRARHGLGFVPLGVGTLRQSLEVLKSGGMVALAADRDIQGRGLRVPFFGRETSIPVGALELARRTGAVLVPSFSIREADNTFTAYVEPPLALEWDEPHEVALRSNLRKLLAVIERYLRRYPEQWVVFQPIWPKEEGRLGVAGSSHIVASTP